MDCLECKEPMQLLEQLLLEQSAADSVNKLQMSSSSSSSSGHWMLQFPSQCILTIDAILWERCVLSAIENEDKLELKACW